MTDLFPFCNPDFLAKYLLLRQRPDGQNELLEKPASYDLLPDLKDLAILDLGCGYGDFSKHAVKKGAKSVVAVDVSPGMLCLAEQLNSDLVISYVLEDINLFEIKAGSYDLVYSALTFHYIADFTALLQKIKFGLRKGGVLVFSVEHPIVTSQEFGWETDDKGRKIAWRLDSYGVEGRKTSRWLDFNVIKYHRKTETYLSLLLAAGAQIKGFSEPQPSKELVIAHPWLEYELARPPFLILSVSF